MPLWHRRASGSTCHDALHNPLRGVLPGLSRHLKEGAFVATLGFAYLLGEKRTGLPGVATSLMLLVLRGMGTGE